MNPSSNGRTPRRELLRRAGYYLIGVTLGFLMLGLMWRMRDREAAERRAEFERWQSGPSPAAPGAASGGLTETPPAPSVEPVTPVIP